MEIRQGTKDRIMDIKITLNRRTITKRKKKNKTKSEKNNITNIL